MKRLLPLFLISLLTLSSCGKEGDVTSPVAPPAPVLSLPANNSADQAITLSLSWVIATGAETYSLQVALDIAFSNIVFAQNGIRATNKTVDGLTYGHTYYWRVKAVNSTGSSEWSSPVHSFKTISFICGSKVSYYGKNYNTVLIGSQCWMKENLDIGTMLDGSLKATNNGIIEKYCYDNNESNCTTYGALYQWDEAMAYNITAGSRGICPPGFHIPTDPELKILADAAGNDGTKLKATSQGTGAGAGNDSTGFSGMLGGSRFTNNLFSSIDGYGYLWSSTEGTSTNALFFRLGSLGTTIYFFSITKEYGFNIRCLKD